MRSEIRRCALAALCLGALFAAPEPAQAAPRGKPRPGAAPALTPAQQRKDMEELAELYAQEGRLDDALSLFAELRAADPDGGKEHRYWRRPAELLEAQGDRQAELLLLLQAWRAQSPTLAEPTVRLAQLYLQDGATDEAVKILDEMLRSQPAGRQDMELLRAKAQILEDARRIDPALAAWAAVLARPSATVEDRWHHAELMGEKGDSPAHREALAGLVAARPKDVRFRVAYGESLLAAGGQGDLAAAEAQLEAAEALAPRDAGVARLAAALDDERARRAQDKAADLTENRDDLRFRDDAAARGRRLRLLEDY